MDEVFGKRSAADRELRVIDATYGEAPERTLVVGTVDEVRALDLPQDALVAYLTQTTLALDDTREIIEALQERFDDLRGPGSDDTCYASQNRHDAVNAVAATRRPEGRGAGAARRPYPAGPRAVGAGTRGDL